MGKDPYKYFRIEARELLEGLTQGVLALQERPGDKEPLASLLRLAHTLKGASRVVKLTAIGSAAHDMEERLAPHRAAGDAVPMATTQELFRLIDAITGEVNVIAAPGAEAPAPAARAPVAAGKGPAAGAAASGPSAATDAVAAGAAPRSLPSVTTKMTVPERPAAPAPTPPPAAPAPAAPLQIADTVRVEIADVDAILSSLSEATAQVSALRQGALAGKRVRDLVNALGLALGRAPPGALESVRGLLGDLTAASTQSERPLAAGVDRLDRELGQVRDKVSQLRLLPAQTIFAPLIRAANDAADSLGKRIEVSSAGGEARLEAHVLSRVRAALLHMVRNAVAHGIEPAAARLAAGKPAAGRVEIRAQRRGNEVTFVCLDDGRGIDWEAVRRTAVERGLCPPEQVGTLDTRRLTQVLLGGGVSTTRVVDEVSGRGVGLNVVDEVVRELRGTFVLESTPGAGARFALTIPISMSALTAIALEVGGHRVWLPLEAVGHTVRVPADQIVRSSDGETILYEEQAIPFAALDRVLNLPSPTGAASYSAALIEVDGRCAAVGAERLGEVATIVVRPIPPVAGAPALVGGATLDAEGNPVLVLSPAGLVEAVTAARARREEAPRKVEKQPILVIDDSLTTRMLEQSILEAAGYEVDTAVSAEDGLKKANERRYGLFLVDVEMPGMNGFEFVAHTRAQPAFRDIPAILVTSLSSAEHRRRGAEVGAYAYMVKGEYDEGRLRQLIRSVIG